MSLYDYGPVSYTHLEYKGLNATSFLSHDFTEDVAGIKWLKKNVKGSPVVLEANGDSYSGYERVSAMTGLPTVLGDVYKRQLPYSINLKI